MSVATDKKLPGKTRRAEEQHLKETLSIIHGNIEHYQKEVAELRADIDTMQAHFHDDNPELINTLENAYTMYEFQNRTLERNERAFKKPYFGRIDFYDQTHDTEEALYIGKYGVSKDSIHPLVIDWRAPVANVYYDNGLGPCSYRSPEDEELPINLKLKRTYEIADGKLVNIFDTEVIANDDLLTSYLSKNKQAVLGEIVATIQKEQNDIIRKSPYHNCLVQGVAGSGKTTVAMHRISYILYNYADRFRPEDFYIVGSNQILLNYITSVLPDLDVHGIRQMTMEQLFVRLLYEDWNPSCHQIQTHSLQNPCKGTLSWFHALEAFCCELELASISCDSVYLDRAKFIDLHSEEREEMNQTLDSKGNESAVSRILLFDGNAAKKYIRENPSVSIQNKINMLNERLRNKIKDEFIGREFLYTEDETKAILRNYRNWYGGRNWKTSIFDLYLNFLSKQREKGFHAEDPQTTADHVTLFDVYDLAALAYLYKRVKETDVIREAHHIVIDEAQDFGMMVYASLKFCITDCTYTIMGDVSQNIHFDLGLNDWEELKNIYIKDALDSFCVLKKSYRNTVEISQFATNILRHGTFSVYPVEPIIRHGEQPRMLLSEAIIESRIDVESIVSLCREWQEKDFNTIAIICRDEQSAKETASALSPFLPLLENPLETEEFGNGIMVLPVDYTKGLEFDAVLILNPTREAYPKDNGHAKLLYVAATRALHELCILHTRNLTGLIADPIDEHKLQSLETFDTSQRQELSGVSSAQIAAKPAQSAVNSLPDTVSAAPRRAVSQIRRPQAEPGTDVAELLASKKLAIDGNAKPVPTRSFGVRAVIGGEDGTSARTGASILRHDCSFGSMPPTEVLRPAGYGKADRTIRIINKQADGMYLRSAYGILRISPINANVIRITLAKDEELLKTVHPKIMLRTPAKKWLYRESPKLLEVKTDALYLQVDKTTGSICYMTSDKRPLLMERPKESKILEKPTFGSPRARLYLDWNKTEALSALGTGKKASLSLKGTARYISHTGRVERLPMLVSDRGYGIVMAADGPVLGCTLPTYGSHLCAEQAEMLDYYFLVGKNTEEIVSLYEELCMM